ncbi:DEAD/DEAH box helicase [Pontibacter amylolyticus]|uniref:DEAD/DEAH box family ATP-dependent RNA helicase n=1 Tax=Pontibacter amylolyticus TaxID=1424080 RepID=A0ABQ1VXX0_9BACT|nr:DEAD/DEAH box helicase [Pontibacter amylolyticus]GGG04983.1 DEAD/DEAH box family ATP-dependent RNA helicase [Pontibacter amylolyticus]
MTFSELNLIDPILKALQAEGYTQPTPIQEQAIPHLLAGRDVLGCAQTGTGKTAAFAIPVLQMLHNQKNRASNTIKTLILTPTRELAIQINESFASYGKNTGVRHTVIFGGVSQHAQVQTIKRGVDVLIATPGRLLDLIGQGFISLKHVEFFVLDEADRMLDMGFIHDIKRIIPMLPKQRQSLFFSATMPPVIQALADTILINPVKVEVTPASSTAEKVGQAVYFVEKNDKRDLLRHLLTDSEIDRVLVFTRTKHGADRVAKDLNKANIQAEAIHGNKSQNARQRALSNFKDGSTRVLVATDIAARGIDVEELSHVINYELPNEPETYVHRIGRTGRAGNAGIALSFCDEEERYYLHDIQKLINKQIKVDANHPFALPEHLSVNLENAKKPKGPAGREPRNGGASNNGGRAAAGGNRPSGNRGGNSRSGGGEGGNRAAASAGTSSRSTGGNNRNWRDKKGTGQSRPSVKRGS